MSKLNHLSFSEFMGKTLTGFDLDAVERKAMVRGLNAVGADASNPGKSTTDYDRWNSFDSYSEILEEEYASPGEVVIKEDKLLAVKGAKPTDDHEPVDLVVVDCGLFVACWQSYEV